MHTLRLAPASFLVFAALASFGQAGEISSANYLNHFTSGAADFTTSGTWALNSGGAGFFGHNDAGNLSGLYTASVQHTALGGSAATASGFSFTAGVTYTGDGVASGNELGVAFLTGTANLDATTNGYRVYVRGTASGGASVFLVRNNVVVASAGSAAAELRDFFGDTLTFSITGDYTDAAGGDGINDALALDVTVTNTTETQSFSLSFLDTAPLAGNFFGIRDHDQSGSFGFNAQWDYVGLSVAAIPEPATTAALSGVFAAGFAALRRRRR